MKIGRVAGTVVSTINDPFFDGKSLLLCDLLDHSGHPDGYTIAVDVVSAGVGDTVLILGRGQLCKADIRLDHRCRAGRRRGNG